MASQEFSMMFADFITGLRDAVEQKWHQKHGFKEGESVCRVAITSEFGATQVAMRLVVHKPGIFSACMPGKVIPTHDVEAELHLVGMLTEPEKKPYLVEERGQIPFHYMGPIAFVADTITDRLWHVANDGAGCCA